MTRKHYNAIAEILRICKSDNVTVNALADYLAKDNPAFDKVRFIAATK